MAAFQVVFFNTHTQFILNQILIIDIDEAKSNCFIILLKLKNSLPQLTKNENKHLFYIFKESRNAFLSSSFLILYLFIGLKTISSGFV